LVAEIVEEALTATPRDVTLKVADTAPAATVTLEATVAAAVLLLERVTTAPPGGARPVSVTVPVDGLPPTTDAGLRLIVETAIGTGGVTVSVADLLTPEHVAVTVTLVEEPTVKVVTENETEAAPSDTFTVEGTAATAGFELESVTTAPPGGADSARVTVPVSGNPPTMLVGLRERSETAGGVARTVRAAVFESM
jgi:hypothetical protein